MINHTESNYLFEILKYIITAQAGSKQKRIRLIYTSLFRRLTAMISNYGILQIRNVMEYNLFVTDIHNGL